MDVRNATDLRDDLFGPTVPGRVRAALIELLRERDLAEISVKELCARACVARSTFYAHYRNADEALCEIERSLVADLIKINAPLTDCALSTPDDLAFFSQTLAYIEHRREAMEVLLVRRPSARFIAAWKSAIVEHLRVRSGRTLTSHCDAFVRDIAASAVISAYTYLLEHPGAVDEASARRMLSEVLAILG